MSELVATVVGLWILFGMLLGGGSDGFWNN